MLFTDNRTNIQYVVTTIALSFIVLTLGCASTSPLNLNSVQYIDSGLDNSMIVDSISIGQSNVGNPQLNMLVRNTSNQPLLIELSTAWYDANFVATEVPTGWKRVLLSKKQTHVFNVSATQKASTHFVVNVRKGGR